MSVVERKKFRVEAHVRFRLMMQMIYLDSTSSVLSNYYGISGLCLQPRPSSPRSRTTHKVPIKDRQ